MSEPTSRPAPEPASQPALPARPCLEWYRKQARALLKAYAAGSSEATRRVSRHLPRAGDADGSGPLDGPLRLHHAQLVLAREHGFPSWTRLKRQVEAVAAARCRPFETDPGYYDDRARGLLSAHLGGERTAIAQVGCFHPRCAGATEAEIAGARLTLDDARLVQAREHGFESWEALTRHVERLARGEAEEPFQQAFHAIRERNPGRLRRLLAEHPDLARARGTNGNTLLNLAAGSFPMGSCAGAPERAPDGYGDGMECVLALLGAGADIDLANNRGWTPLHQAAYSDHTALARLLLERGAALDTCAHGDGGTPLLMALFWGHTRPAELLAARRIVPLNLRTAAGLGRVELLAAFFDAAGALRPEAGRERGFYRPHSGFPVWRPTDDPQEILDEALVYAAKSGHAGALDFLLARGASVNAEPYNGSALHWAAGKGRTEAMVRLLDHGADVNLRARYGGARGVTPLHIAAWAGQTESAALLLDRGADLEARDPEHHGAPSGWADFAGHIETRDFLLSRQGLGSAEFRVRSAE